MKKALLILVAALTAGVATLVAQKPLGDNGENGQQAQEQSSVNNEKQKDRDKKSDKGPKQQANKSLNALAVKTYGMADDIVTSKCDETATKTVLIENLSADENDIELSYYYYVDQLPGEKILDKVGYHIVTDGKFYYYVVENGGYDIIKKVDSQGNEVKTFDWESIIHSEVEGMAWVEGNLYVFDDDNNIYELNLDQAQATQRLHIQWNTLVEEYIFTSDGGELMIIGIDDDGIIISTDVYSTSGESLRSIATEKDVYESFYFAYDKKNNLIWGKQGGDLRLFKIYGDKMFNVMNIDTNNYIYYIYYHDGKLYYVDNTYTLYCVDTDIFGGLSDYSLNLAPAETKSIKVAYNASMGYIEASIGVYKEGYFNDIEWSNESYCYTDETISVSTDVTEVDFGSVILGSKKTIEVTVNHKADCSSISASPSLLIGTSKITYKKDYTQSDNSKSVYSLTYTPTAGDEDITGKFDVKVSNGRGTSTTATFDIKAKSLPSPEASVSVESISIADAVSCGDDVVASFSLSNSSTTTALEYKTCLFRNRLSKTLIITDGVDQTEELPHTIAAIKSGYAGFTYETFSDGTADGLREALNGIDIVLIPEIEKNCDTQYAAYAPELQSFANNGGKVVFCGTSTKSSINATGLLNITENSSDSNATITVSGQSKYTQGLSSHQNGNATYIITESSLTADITYGNKIVLGHKSYGTGEVIYYGADFYEYAESQIKVMTNIFGIETTELTKGTVAAGESEDVDIRLSTEGVEAGDREWSIFVYTNDKDNASFSIPLTFKVQGKGKPAFDVSELNFEAIEVATSTEATVRVENIGCSNLDITGVEFSTGISSVVTTSAIATTTIAPGAGMDIALTFAPTEATTYSGTMTVKTTEGNIDLAIKGTGSPYPVLSVSQTEITIAEAVTRGNNLVVPITLGNTGLGVLNYVLEINGEGVAEGSIAANGSKTVNVTLETTTDSPGSYYQNITVKTQDKHNSDVTIKVNYTVTGTVAGELSSTAVSFSDLSVGESYGKTIFLTNTGESTISVSNVVKSAGFDSAFKLTNSTETAYKESSPIVIRFAPSAAGTYSESVKLQTNAGDFTINVTGKAVAAPTAEFDKTIIVADEIDCNEKQVLVTVKNTGTTPVKVRKPAELLTSLDLSSVAALIPDQNMFELDNTETGNYIDDGGGDDMYDDGNYLSTNYESEFYYTGGKIVEGGAMGTNGRYVTDMNNGIFYLAAFLDGVTEFKISGELGADGYGYRDCYEFEIGRYKAYCTATFGSGDPSVNHIILLPSDVDATHYYSTDTDDDEQEVSGIGSAKELYYLLFSTSESSSCNIADFEKIAREFVRIIESSTTTIEAGESKGIAFTITGTDKADGKNTETAILATNIPDKEYETVEIEYTVAKKAGIYINQESIDMGAVLASSETATKTLRITNTGCADLTITSATLSSSDVFAIVSTPSTIDAGESRDVTISMATATKGTFSATLTLETNVGKYSIPVTGSVGSSPVASVEDIVLEEALTCGNTTIDVTIPIKNTGDANLLIQDGEAAINDVGECFEGVSSLIPNQFIFSLDRGAKANYISDGEDDMYDDGNYLSTNFKSNFYYTDGEIVKDGTMGTNGGYVTGMVDGIFYLAADLDGVTSFKISGGLGADGYGSRDGYVFDIDNYTAYCTSTHDAGDPSIIHIILVKTGEGITQEYSSNTDYDNHQVSGLKNTNRLYYLLMSTGSTTPTEDDIKAIASKFIENVSSVGFMTVKPGETYNKTVAINMTGAPEGAFKKIINIKSDDPVNPSKAVSISGSIDYSSDATGIVSSTDNVEYPSVSIDKYLYKEIELVNPNCFDLKITSVTLSDDTPFSLLEDLADYELKSNTSVKMTVFFEPTKEGEFSDNLVVNTDKSGMGTTIALSGKGVGRKALAVYCNSTDGNYKEGDEIYIDVLFNSNIYFEEEPTEYPSLKMNTGSSAEYVDILNNVMRFKYTVGAEDQVTVLMLSKLEIEGDFTLVDNNDNEILKTLPNNISASSKISLGDVIETPTGIADEQVKIGFDVYPNPATDYIKVSVNNDVDGIVEIYSISGAKIFADKFAGKSKTLNVSGYASGIYVVRVATDNEVFAKRWIKK